MDGLDRDAPDSEDVGIDRPMAETFGAIVETRLTRRAA